MPIGAARIGFRFKPTVTEIDFVANFLVLTYTFTDGMDLDTRTRMNVPNLGLDYVGWGHQSAASNILFWGGDNTDQGVESVYVNIDNFRAAYPNTNTMMIDCRCMWYRTVGNQPVRLDVVLYKGGAMESNGYGFANPTAVDSIAMSSQSKPITLYSQLSGSPGERLATLTYNTISGLGSLDSDDTSPTY